MRFQPSHLAVAGAAEPLLRRSSEWSTTAMAEVDAKARALAVGDMRLPASVGSGPTESFAAGGLLLRRAVNAGEAARILRGRDGQFDLVLIGARLPAGHNAWAFATRLRQARPWQAWALVAGPGEITRRAERYALSLGAAGVFDGESAFAALLGVAVAVAATRVRAGLAAPPPDWSDSS